MIDCEEELISSIVPLHWKSVKTTTKKEHTGCQSYPFTSTITIKGMGFFWCLIAWVYMQVLHSELGQIT